MLALKPSSAIDRLLARTERVTESGCWIWMGVLNRDGYSSIGVARKTKSGHRVSFEHFRGPVPAGCELDHLCRIRCCVNPDHLEPVLHATNVRRGSGPTAVNARKTHCDQGHFLALHGRPIKGGGRYCRTCKTTNARLWWRAANGWNERRADTGGN